MRTQAFFLGCVIPLRFPGIEAAARRVFGRLGVECVDLDGYSCCPEPVVLSLTDRDMALAVSARNLALAERADADLVVLCNGCYETLAEAEATLAHDEGARTRVGRLLGEIGVRYEGKVRVKHFIEFLHEDVGPARIARALDRPLDLALSLHYGCHLFRETRHADTWRKPRMMRALLEAMGARCVETGLEQLCCGFPMAQFDKTAALTERLAPKLRALGETSAEALAFCCPACLNQFETGQGSLADLKIEAPRIPCVHLLELLGVCTGMTPAELCLDFRSGATKEFFECFWG
ncbi:MAG: heterodisulfide reductase-related iron-sulfur binding cluster [Candidatus Methylomirabilota bacterium]